jgi:clan AA aspartic protease
VRDAAGQEQPIETILDTGFTGSLTLPGRVIAGLGLPWRSRGYAVLANGALEQFDIYAATVAWDGEPCPVLVHSVDSDPLLGTALLVGCDLRVRVEIGGGVEIEAIP